MPSPKGEDTVYHARNYVLTDIFHTEILWIEAGGNMSIQVEGRKVKSKPDAVAIQIGAGVFSCPIDWDDPDDVFRVFNKAIALAQAPLRNEINRLLRENAELKRQIEDQK